MIISDISIYSEPVHRAGSGIIRMRSNILYLILTLLCLCGCSDSVSIDREGYWATLDYAIPEKSEIVIEKFESIQDVPISSNCKWTYSTESEWLSADNSKEDRITLSASENHSDTVRTATINIYKDELRMSSITVHQKPYYVSLVAQNGNSANCYMVSDPDTYSFPTVKGNSNTSVGEVGSVEVLWESFGTSTVPTVGDLITYVEYVPGEIIFSTSSDYLKEGNAVIAAKRKDGTILWSWHIWFTDKPIEHTYYGSAVMMDRNLGATSADPGQVTSFGLLYQWGRKDPFLGASAISYYPDLAKSTNWWPGVDNFSSAPESSKIPMAFIEGWHPSDDDAWTTSDKEKSINDPCPPGWRVPDVEVWFDISGNNFTFDSTNRGVDFKDVLGPESKIWYPAPGVRQGETSSTWRAGELILNGSRGEYWAATSKDNTRYYLYMDGQKVEVRLSDVEAHGKSIRCLNESYVIPPSRDVDEIVMAYLDRNPEGFTCSKNGTAISSEGWTCFNVKSTDGKKIAVSVFGETNALSFVNNTLVMTLKNGRATAESNALREARYISFDVEFSVSGYNLIFSASYTTAAYSSFSITHTIRLDPSIFN